MELHKNDLPDDIFFEKSVAIDTETLGLNWKRDRLCLVQLCSADGNVHLVQIKKDMQHEAHNLKKILTDPSILKIFHFARFDVGILNYALNINVNSIYCTKIASKLSRTYTDRHGLKNLCKELLDVDISKQEQSSDWGKSILSADQMKYAANDVIHLHKIKNKLDDILIRENRMQIAKQCFLFISTIVSLEMMDFNPEIIFQH